MIIIAKIVTGYRDHVLRSLSALGQALGPNFTAPGRFPSSSCHDARCSCGQLVPITSKRSNRTALSCRRTTPTFSSSSYSGCVSAHLSSPDHPIHLVLEAYCRHCKKCLCVPDFDNNKDVYSFCGPGILSPTQLQPQGYVDSSSILLRLGLPSRIM